MAERIVAAREDVLIGSVLLYPGGSSAPAPDGSIIDFAAPEGGSRFVPPVERGRGIARVTMLECARRVRAGSGVPTLHTMAMIYTALALRAGTGCVRVLGNGCSLAPDILVRACRLISSRTHDRSGGRCIARLLRGTLLAYLAWARARKGCLRVLLVLRLHRAS